MIIPLPQFSEDRRACCKVCPHATVAAPTGRVVSLNSRCKKSGLSMREILTNPAIVCPERKFGVAVVMPVDSGGSIAVSGGRIVGWDPQGRRCGGCGG